MCNTAWRFQYKGGRGTAAAWWQRWKIKRVLSKALKMLTSDAFTFWFPGVILPEVMFSVQVPLQTDQLPHGGQLQYLSRLENNGYTSFMHSTCHFTPQRRVRLFRYLFLLTDHNELQHWHVVSPRIDLCEVVEVRRQRAQTPLDDPPSVN